MKGAKIMNKSYIPKYIYKFPTNLPHGDKKIYFNIYQKNDK